MNPGKAPDARMKALVLHGVGDARLESVRKPAPGADEVLVRVGLCGVCGSDIPRIFEKGTYRFPLICGHEFAGTVEGCGEDVTAFAAGNRVTVFPLLWCGKCPACEKGLYAQCSDYDYLGSRRDGAFAEYVVAPARNLIVIPEGVSLEEAAMTEPAAVALHALRRAGGSLEGETVAIFGAGTIGLIAAQWARISGAGRVLLFDIVPEKLELARSVGFDLVFESTTRDPVEVIEEVSGGQGAHLCLEAAGVPATVTQALASAGRGGRVVLLGNPTADVTLPATLISQAMRREISVLGTWNSSYTISGSGDDWHTALAAMDAGKLQVRPLVTHKVSLDQAPEALEMMRTKKEFFGKVLVNP